MTPAGVRRGGGHAWRSRGRALALRRQPGYRRSNAGSRGGALQMTQPWTLLAGGARVGIVVGRQATRPMAFVVSAGQRAGARLALDAVDALLASTTADVATDRVLASPWTARTVNKALTGPLVDVAARDIAEGAVLERVLDEVLATEVLDHIVDRAEEAGVVHRL